MTNRFESPFGIPTAKPEELLPGDTVCISAKGTAPGSIANSLRYQVIRLTPRREDGTPEPLIVVERTLDNDVKGEEIIDPTRFNVFKITESVSSAASE